MMVRAIIVTAVLSLALLAASHPSQAAVMRTSYYGAESGRFNADGSRFNPGGFTAAHRSLPFGTQLQACYRGCVVVTVRDRGPGLWTGRSLDLARGAASAIGLTGPGVANIDVTVVGRAAARQRRSRRRR